MPDPMYRQIAEDLRQKIESGELGHGDQLPTELELREQYDASRNTVRDAVKWLITRGLVETRPGQGTFVVEKIDPFVTTLSERSGDRARRWRRHCLRLRGAGAGPGANDHQAAGRDPAAAARWSRPNCSSTRARPSSAGTSSASSMARPGRCRPRSTRCASSSEGAVRLIQAEDMTGVRSTTSAGQLGHQAGRLPRQDHGPAARPRTSGVLQAARRRPRSGVRDLPDRLQRAWPAASAHGQRLSPRTGTSSSINSAMFHDDPEPAGPDRGGRNSPVARGAECLIL